MAESLFKKLEQQAREARLRRALAKEGYALHKSRLRTSPHSRDLGEYMVVDTQRNAIILGSQFECTLDDIEAWCTDLPA